MLLDARCIYPFVSCVIVSRLVFPFRSRVQTSLCVVSVRVVSGCVCVCVHVADNRGTMHESMIADA